MTLAAFEAPVGQQHGGAHTPREVFESWRDANPDRPAKSVDAFEAALQRCELQFPGRNVESLTRADGMQLEAGLKRWADEGGKSRTTAANILARIKTLLNHAHDLEWVPRNPFEGRTIEKAKSTRGAFSSADLSQIFDSTIFTHYELPEVAQAGADAAYWLPLLGLSTGARISELAQLWTDDVSETVAAGLVIFFKPDKQRSRSIKSRSRMRGASTSRTCSARIRRLLADNFDEWRRPALSKATALQEEGRGR